MVTPLAAPTAVDPRHDAIEYIFGASIFAPSWYVSKYCEVVLGVEPFDKVAELFAGDWKAIDEASGALATLALFNEESASAVRDELALMSSWTGNTAVGAGTYFQGLAGALDVQAPVLRELADTIDQFARSVYAQAKSAAAAVEAIFDYGTTALICKAAAEAARAVGNLPTQLGMQAQVAHCTVQMIEKWNVVLAKMAAAWTALQFFESAARFAVAKFDSVALPELPHISYDNPEV